MPNAHPYPIDWLFLGLNVIFTIMFLAEAWVNIIDQRVSSFSLDAVLLYLVKNIGTRKSKQNARAFPRNKAEIIFLGSCALLTGLKAAQQVVLFFGQYKKP